MIRHLNASMRMSGNAERLRSAARKGIKMEQQEQDSAFDEGSFDAGWREAIETFTEGWQSKRDDISREELISSTDRLLLLLHPATENPSEKEIAARIRRGNRMTFEATGK
jgi:hypothetical protein